MHGDRIKNIEYDQANGCVWKEVLWPTLNLHWENFTLEEAKRLQNDSKSFIEDEQSEPEHELEKLKEITGFTTNKEKSQKTDAENEETAITVENGTSIAAEEKPTITMNKNKSIVDKEEIPEVQEDTSSIFKGDKKYVEPTEIWTVIASEIIENAVNEVAQEKEPNFIKVDTTNSLLLEPDIHVEDSITDKKLLTSENQIGILKSNVRNIEHSKNIENISPTVENNISGDNEKKSETYENARNLMEMILQEHEEARKKAIGIPKSDNSNESNAPDIVSGRYFAEEKQQLAFVIENFKNDTIQQTENKSSMLTNTERCIDETTNTVNEISTFKGTEENHQKISPSSNRNFEKENKIELQEPKNAMEDKTKLQILLTETINDLIETIEKQKNFVEVPANSAISEKIEKSKVSQTVINAKKHIENRTELNYNKQGSRVESLSIGKNIDPQYVEQVESQKTPTAAIEALLEEMEKLHDLSEKNQVKNETTDSTKETVEPPKLFSQYVFNSNEEIKTTIETNMQADASEPSTNITEQQEKSELKDNGCLKQETTSMNTENNEEMNDAVKNPLCSMENESSIETIISIGDNIVSETMNEIITKVEKLLDIQTLPTGLKAETDEVSNFSTRMLKKDEKSSSDNDISAVTETNETFKQHNANSSDEPNGYILEVADGKNDHETVEEINTKQECCANVVTPENKVIQGLENTTLNESEKAIRQEVIEDIEDAFYEKKKVKTKDSITNPLYKNVLAEGSEEDESHSTQSKTDTITENLKDSKEYLNELVPSQKSIERSNKAERIDENTLTKKGEETTMIGEVKSELIQKINYVNNKQNEPETNENKLTSSCDNSTSNKKAIFLQNDGDEVVKPFKKNSEITADAVTDFITNIKGTSVVGVLSFPETKKNESNVHLKEKQEKMSGVALYKKSDSYEDSSFSAELTQQAECCASIDGSEADASQDNSDFFGPKKKNELAISTEKNSSINVNTSEPKETKQAFNAECLIPDAEAQSESDKKAFLEKVIAENQALSSKLPKSSDYFGSGTNKFLEEGKIFRHNESFETVDEPVRIALETNEPTEYFTNNRNPLPPIESEEKTGLNVGSSSSEAKQFFKRPHKRGRGHFKAPFFDQDQTEDPERTGVGETFHSEGRNRQRRSKKSSKRN